MLRERQNARYHAIVDSAPDAMITTTLDRTIQWVNGAAELVFGYALSELLGQKVDLLLAEEGELARAFEYGTAAASDASKPLQIVGRTKKAGSPTLRCHLASGDPMAACSLRRSGAT